MTFKMVQRNFNKILLRKATENALADLSEAVMPKMPVHRVFFKQMPSVRLSLNDFVFAQQL